MPRQIRLEWDGAFGWTDLISLDHFREGGTRFISHELVNRNKSRIHEPWCLLTVSGTEAVLKYDERSVIDWNRLVAQAAIGHLTISFADASRTIPVSATWLDSENADDSGPGRIVLEEDEAKTITQLVPTKFEIGRAYSRADVARIIGKPYGGGGNWDTGYDNFNGENFIFCNVGSAGRTGHDYANQWVGRLLSWRGKTASHIRQPSIQRMLLGHEPVHIFWRVDDRSNFTYGGTATPLRFEDTKPVTVVWECDTKTNGHPEGKSSKPASWRPGPPPRIGNFSVVNEPGPTFVYVMVLEAALKLLPNISHGHSIYKVGYSNDLRRREFELNSGFPPTSHARWKLHFSELFQSNRAAFEREQQCHRWLNMRELGIGGEFCCLSSQTLSQLQEIIRHGHDTGKERKP